MSENNINRVKIFLKGDVIFHEGQPSDHFYVLQKGEVEVSIRKNEKRVVIGTLGPGEFFGEMGLLSNEPRSASCRAITPVEVARIGNEDFKKLLKSSHPLVGKIINVLLKRLKRSNSLSASKPVPANSFYAVANLLDLNFRAANTDSLLAGPIIQQITATLGILPHQAKAILQRFVDFGLIQTIQHKGTANFQEEQDGRLLLLSNSLLAEAIIIQDQQPDKILPDSLSSDMELMEIKQALELYGIDEKKFYSKMGAGELPDHLFLINKSVMSGLMQNKGRLFFEDPVPDA
jgi:CRP-like cAMP-binding protein